MAATIVWFRRDLRLADNPALAAALKSGSPVIPVFIWAPDEEAPWAPGSASRWWLHQSLEKLDGSLRACGSGLVIRRGPTAETLIGLIAETGAGSIYWNRLYEPAIVARDKAVKQRLRDSGFGADSFAANLLFEPWTIHNGSGHPYRVFTAFWKACLAAPAPPPPDVAPTRIPAPSTWPQSLALSDLGLEPRIDWAAGLRQTWQPGEAGAAEKLDRFAGAGIGAYSAERDRPDRPGTSELSPHLHFGEIGPRQVWHRVHAQEGNGQPYLRQIAWREFAHHLLFHFPLTPAEPLRPEFNLFPWRPDEERLKAWTRGRTGYPLVDAGMRQLWTTGWMHNRIRLVAGSFLVKHLLIPWQEGAAWFWDTLVDADLANNTMGWQWIAGCGADAAPYFRIFNPVLQGEKFDPGGDYVRRWVPELAKLPAAWIHKPFKAPASILAQAGVKLGKTYPLPIVNHEEARKQALAAYAKIRGSTKASYTFKAQRTRTD